MLRIAGNDGKVGNTFPLASAIRSISALVSNRAGCEDIALAVCHCMASSLSNAGILVLEVTNEPSLAKVIASFDLPFATEPEFVTIESGSHLQRTLQVPYQCHFDGLDKADGLIPADEDMAAEGDIVIASKAVHPPGADPVILNVFTPSNQLAETEAALMTMSELLRALCARHDLPSPENQEQYAIHNAKNEWEATVDALGDLVCLVDGSGRILRANRTAERWRLSSVANVRGMKIHEILHPDCSGDECALFAATDMRRFVVGSVDSCESVIVDEVLERALRVQIQRVPQLPGGDSRHSAMAVVIIANVTALHNARNDLKNLNENLEQQVRERTTALLRAVARLKRENEQRKAAELDLQESRDELAQLSQQLMHAQETERSRLSRELHDSVGQSLGAIKYTLERLAAAHSHGTDDDADRILGRAITGVAEAIRDMRSIAMRLRPPILDDMGAAAAVQWLVRGFSQTYPDIQFHLETSVSNEDIPLQLSTHIYRIAQEALNNAVKHAQPDSVLVSICQKSTQLALEIIDDGVGFQMNASDTGQFRQLGHFGHLGMRERVSNSNGIISIRSAPGQGTKVKVEWDLNTDSSVKEQIA